MSLDVGVVDSIVTIADDFFTAMITGEPGSVFPVEPGTHTLPEVVHAWVDVNGSYSARALLSTDPRTADEIARALLGMSEGEAVTEEDLVDAFGEMANVIGGNIKSMLPEQGKMTLPQVAREAPPAAEVEPVSTVELDWAGRGLVVTIWQL